MSRVFPIVNYVVALLFAVSGVLQYNDPDPWPWVLIYLAAAAACLIRASRGPALVVLVISLAWAAWMAPRVIPSLEPGNLVKEMHASTPAIEESREMLGLLIIAAWMAVVALRKR